MCIWAEDNITIQCHVHVNGVLIEQLEESCTTCVFRLGTTRPFSVMCMFNDVLTEESCTTFVFGLRTTPPFSVTSVCWRLALSISTACWAVGGLRYLLTLPFPSWPSVTHFPTNTPVTVRHTMHVSGWIIAKMSGIGCISTSEAVELIWDVVTVSWCGLNAMVVLWKWSSPVCDCGMCVTVTVTPAYSCGLTPECDCGMCVTVTPAYSCSLTPECDCGMCVTVTVTPAYSCGLTPECDCGMCVTTVTPACGCGLTPV